MKRMLFISPLLLSLLVPAPASSDPASVRKLLLSFAGAPTRYLGTPGHRATVGEIERIFRSAGLTRVRRDRFTVVAPVDEGAWIEGPGLARTTVHMVWPNNAQPSVTPPAGITGPLVDAGHGEAEALDGRDVGGAIALVRLPCAEGPLAWTTPFVLGAAAVVFVPPADGAGFSRTEAEELFLDVPANLPRYWAAAPAAVSLVAAAKRGARVTLRGRAAWRPVDVENVLGELPGTDPKAARIILQSYTDAMSVVPALAPGAEEAGGLVALAELARHFGARPAPHPLLFLATSGHGHVLSGPHEFLSRHLRRREYFTKSQTAGESIEAKLFIGLDLSTGDRRVASFAQGTLYTGWDPHPYAQNALAGLARGLDGHAKRLWAGAAGERYLNGVAPVSRTWKDLLGWRAAFDAEAATNAGTPGLTFATPFDGRLRADTPGDLPARADAGALAAQVETLTRLLDAAFRDPRWLPELKLELPDNGRALRGEVHEYEQTVTGLPNRPVPGALMTYRAGVSWSNGSRKTHGPVRSLHAVFTRRDDPLTPTVSETGTFRIAEVRVPEYWSWVGVTLRGFVFDDTGGITLASDLGPLVAGQFSAAVGIQEREPRTIHVLFKTRPLTILEPVDARNLRFLDAVTLQDGLDQPFMNAGWAVTTAQATATEDHVPAVTLFPPAYRDRETRVKALLTTGPFGLQGVFTGVDEALLDEGAEFGLTEAQGRGYPATGGVLARGPFEGAKDLWALDDARGRTLRQYHVRNARIEGLHDRARAALDEARLAWKDRRYRAFLEASRRAWGLEARAYPEFKTVANDLVRTVVFFCALLLPFAFCMERLMFAYPDLRRQLVATAAFFAAGFFALSRVHPAFRISSNPAIIFLAFVILALGLFVLGLVTTKFQRELRRLKGERGDYEAVDLGRMSATVAALMLGLSNLRRRPMRTALTIVTVMVLTFTLLSMVSLSSTIGFFRMPRGGTPPYAGALVREAAWQVLQPPVESYLRSALEREALLLPRSWVTARKRDEPLTLELTAGGRGATVQGLLGLTAGETAVVDPKSAFGLAGRWLRPDDRQVILLPRVVAGRLGVAPGGRVRVRAMELEVIGVFDGAKFAAHRDLDGEPLTPARAAARRGRYNWEAEAEPKPTTSPGERFAAAEHLPGDAVAIVPHAMALALEGRTRAIAVVPRPGVKPEDLVARVKEFLTRAAVLALVSDGKSVQLLTSIGAISVTGTLDLLLPIMLAGLIVMNTMLGSVHERTREISILSSVGLAPMHIGALFVAEAFVVAVVGVVLGYLLAQMVAAALLSAGSLAGLSLNYSSGGAVGACAIVIGAVMLSTIYPARRASELSVPDVTRRWTLPPPVGDRLEFDFPFTVGDADLIGLFAYLTDLFKAYRDSSIGSFATDRVEMTRTERGVAIDMICWLAPYDLGISQTVRMEATPMEVRGLNRIRIELERSSGEAGSWYRQNRRFLTTLRKRFLIWRMLGEDRRKEYTARGAARMEATRG